LQQRVADEAADFGIAFDGDGDRVLFVDANGDLVDGDELLFIIAAERLRRGKACPGVVGTLMSNLGFELALKDLGVGFERANVGDRYVKERMNALDWDLGGENSGHIICADVSTTGDGIVAALKVVGAIVGSGKSLAELRAPVSKFPQIMENVCINSPVDLKNSELVAAVEAVELELAGRGRVLLRASGTEPLLRVMVEGEDATQVAALCQRLADKVRKLSS
jgi:phosphoglucosamine mutase